MRQEQQYRRSKIRSGEGKQRPATLAAVVYEKVKEMKPQVQKHLKLIQVGVATITTTTVAAASSNNNLTTYDQGLMP